MIARLFRSIFCYFIAGIIPTVIYSVLVGAGDDLAFSTITYAKFMLAMGAIFTFIPFTLINLSGLLFQFIMSKFKITAFFIYPISGVIFGYVVGLFSNVYYADMLSENSNHIMFGKNLVIFFTLSGIVIQTLFWLLRRPDLDATRTQAAADIKPET